MSLTLIVSSVSSSGVSAIRPGRRHRQTGRRGLEPHGHQLVVDAQIADDLADAFVGDEEIADRSAHVVARRVERPAAASREVEEPGDRTRRLLRGRERLDGNGARVEIERVGAVPADEGGAGSPTTALDGLDVLETGAVALETDAGRRRLERLAVRHAVGDLHPAEAVGREVIAVDVELAAERAVEVVVVQRERMPQVRNRTSQ